MVLGVFLKQETLGRTSPQRNFITPTFIVSAVIGVGLLFWISPLAPLLLAGAVCAGAVVLFLLQRPLAALYIALFIRLIPLPDPPAEVPNIVTYIQNAAIALAFLAWLLHAPSQRPAIRWNGVYLFIMLYIAWSGITLLWTHDIVAGLEKLRRLSAGLIFVVLIGNLIISERAIDGLMRVLALIGWGIVISGLWAALFTSYHAGERLMIEGLNQNGVGQYLILMLPGAIWPVLRSSGLRRNVHLALSIVYVLFVVVNVLLSGSRGSALALAITFVALCSWKPFRPWAIAGGALVACLLAAAPFLLDTLITRIEEADGGKFGGRDILWKASLSFIEDHPLTGAGVGSGGYELIPYVAALTHIYDHRDALNPIPPHNPLLASGVDTGIFGMALYFGILLAALWQFFRSRKQLSMRGGALAAYFPILLAAAMGYLTAFFKDGSDSEPPFYFLIGLFIIPSQLLRYSSLISMGPRRIVAPSPSRPSGEALGLQGPTNKII